MTVGEAKKSVSPLQDRAQVRAPEKPQLRLVSKVEVDRSRDDLLTDFGKTTLEDRYLLPGESYQDMFARVATAYADDGEHAQRIYDYISRLWFMPATPVLSNGGAERGLPISCFLNAVSDSLDGIVGVWNENVWLAANGGGIGTYWGGVRSIGEKVKGQGQTSGIIPFIRVMDSLTLAISQGSLRRGSAAVYLDIHHPEIEEFLEIRKPSGDFNRKALNLHHGINLTDEFMEAVRDGAPFGLRSPKTKDVVKTVDARALWQKIIEIRLQTGEPYLIFSDTVNRAMPQHQRELGMQVRQSNLCSEIMLHTGKDHLGQERTAVCCLSSVNAEKFLEWRDHPTFVEDVMRFLD
ncbi:MAG: ribonucleotide reductase N-terminal alpha domain-containing protein, partial [Caulobacteraceae bacterium]